MQHFVRGQRAKISQISDRTNRFNLQVNLTSAAVPVFDFACFGVDAKGQLSDDRYMVFYNQKSAPDASIILEELGDQRATFKFDLDLVPPTIERLVFTVSVDGSGSMKDLGASALVLSEADLPGSQPVAQYPFSGADFPIEGALMLAEVYRKEGVWRFWAQGQGFTGNLSALLAYFGGVEIEESAAPPVQTQPAQQPSAPISAPVVSSIPVNVPVPNVIPLPQNALQNIIHGAPTGATVQLPRGEYQGPILIDRPVILEGPGAVIWGHNGPVVRVQSGGVTLRGVQIEVTDPDENVPDSDVALHVEGSQPVLQDVAIRGRVIGMADESAGAWNLPPFLDLGEFAPRAQNSFIFALEVPTSCRLKTDISGLQLMPAHIEAGRSEIQIMAAGIGSNTFLAGRIEVESAGLVRTIPLSGRAGGPDSGPVQNHRIGAVDGA